MRPLRTTPAYTSPRKRSFTHFLKPLIGICVIVSLVAVGWFYQARALPNVQLAAAPVGQKTMPELVAIAQHQLKKLQFHFVIKNTTINATPSALGIQLDAEKTAAHALRRNIIDGIQVWKPLNVPLHLTINKTKLQHYLQHTFGDALIEPGNASLVYDVLIKEFKTQPGHLGRGFSVDDITTRITEKAWHPGLLVFRWQPTIVPERTEATIAQKGDEANALLRLKLSFLHQKKVMYVAEPTEIATWLQFTPSSQPGKLQVTYNRTAIRHFLNQSVAKSVNDFYGPEGSIPSQDPTVPAPPKPLLLTAVDDLTNDIITALKKQTNLEKELAVTT